MNRRMVQGRRTVYLWLLSAALCASCAREAKPPVTTVVVKHGPCYAARDPRSAAQPVRPHDWLSLLTRLELGHGGVFATRDCLGRPIRVTPPASCGAPTIDDAPSLAPIAEESVVERDLGGSLHVVWIITHRFDDGDGFGLLALVRRDKDGLQTVALGKLRMRTERVKLERWAIQGEHVLVTSGETCSSGGPKPGCRRIAHITLQRGEQLLDAPLLDPSGRCVEPASFELARRQERRLSSGLSRSFELQANITHDARYVVVEERLQVRDTDPSAPLLPAREVQHVETNRFIQPLPGRLVTRQPSLWSRAVEATTSARDAR